MRRVPGHVRSVGHFELPGRHCVRERAMGSLLSGLRAARREFAQQLGDSALNERRFDVALAQLA